MEKNPGKDHTAIFLLLLFLPSEAASDMIVVPVHPGQDAILPCQAADPSISVVEWSRHDPKPEYILFYSDKETDTTIHNPSFKNRVDLSGNELNGGDASLILKNVSSIDQGTYECRVAPAGSKRAKRSIIDSNPIRTIRLQVTDSGSNSKDGNFAFVYLLSLAAVLSGAGCNL
ncbi:nectin-4-like [Sander lucioperca]|uniref:nectin-4-like n=1 Tax=Sander lucioperca TaxID=283035 RepID=UPI001653927B|nr:nectin-4-like [Sander lucioperca]